MATTNILPFAPVDTGTNLLSDAAYLAASDRTNGNQPGVASAKLNNKALRQASAIAAGLAQFMADQQATNITDALTAAQISTILKNCTPGKVLNVQLIAATQIPTFNALTKNVYLRVQGGGGSGGTAVATTATQISAGAGGAAGGYAESYLPIASVAGQTFTIGTGVGGNGGTASVGALITCTGGSVGTTNPAVTAAGSGGVSPNGGSAGGTASGGNILNSSGAPGTFAFMGVSPYGGIGASSMMGGGPPGTSGTGAGAPAVSAGAGGSGGSSLQGNPSNTPGGNGGGPRIIIVELG